MAADTESVVRAYLASFATADPEVIAAHVTENFDNVQVAALGEGCRTRSVYTARLAGFLAEMHQLAYRIEDIIVDGDRAAVSYVLTARWHGEIPIEVPGVQRLTVRDGLVASRVDYWDAAMFLVQIDAEAATALRRFGVT